MITCGTLAGAIIPELVKIFTSTNSRHVREVVTSSREGGASLNILSGLVAGNFSAYWLGIVIMGLMAVAYGISTLGLDAFMQAPAIFAFGLVAFGFLGMGPVTIAVDSYGPVTDNAQSVYELSMIESIPNIKAEIKKDFGFDVNFEVAKDLLEENDGAGNTFKATAKPVLIGTAVVGATTMIFSIIMALTHGLTSGMENLSILHPPFLLGLITGGAVIYWFTGASTQAVTTGAYRAVEFIKANIKLEGSTKASIEDSRKVVEICTQYAQKGMFNIFLGVFFATLAFAFVEPFFFIGYLISIAMFGLYQAIFMANAGGAWDNAKKIVETELKMKGTDLHAATVVGDTVGDPFKDTSSVAHESGDQVHHPLRPARRGAGRLPRGRTGQGSRPVPGGSVPARQHGLRLPLLLWDADRDALGGFRISAPGCMLEGGEEVSPPLAFPLCGNRRGGLHGRPRPQSQLLLRHGPQPTGTGSQNPRRVEGRRRGSAGLQRLPGRRWSRPDRPHLRQSRRHRARGPEAGLAPQ